MKKIIIIAVLATLGFFSVQLLSANETITQDVKELPKKAQEFIKKHFPQEKIARIEIDKEVLDTDYEVVFESGTSIDFAKDGEWKDVDCKASEVPATVVPAKIQSYIKQNYKDQSIVKIEKTHRGYEIDLSNDLDLVFSSKGAFLGIDD